MERFGGKVVIVTGAGSGIGEGTARRFSEEGATVVLVGDHRRNVAAVAADLPKERTLVQVADVSKQGDMEGVVAGPAEDFQEEVQAQLCELKPEFTEVVPEYRTVEGDAIHEILRFAAEHPCDLVILGTHGRTGLGRFLMGSVAEGVVRKAVCPVRTIKAPFPETCTCQAEEVKEAVVAP